jgi:hypothetical protein
MAAAHFAVNPPLHPTRDTGYVLVLGRFGLIRTIRG